MTFDSANEFAEWILRQSQDYKLTLSFGAFHPDLRDALLKAANHWPTTEIRAIEADLSQNLKNVEATNLEQMNLRVNERRFQLAEIAQLLFSIDVLTKPIDTQRMRYLLTSYLNELQRTVAIRPDMDMVLNLPLRLCDQMKLLYELEISTLETMLQYLQNDLTIEKWDQSINDIESKNIYRRVSSGIRSILPSWFYRSDCDGISQQFWDLMTEPLGRLKSIWFETADAAFTTSFDVMRENWSASDMAINRQIYEQSCSGAAQNAFVNLQNCWQNRCHTELTTNIEVRKSIHGIICAVKQDVWNPPAHQIEVLTLGKIGSEAKENWILLGSLAQKMEHALLTMFTVKHHCLLIVSTFSSGTLIRLVQFRVKSSPFTNPCVMSTCIQTIRRVISHCDLNVNERVMVFGDEKGFVSVYKLNESFTSMECTRTFDLNLCTSLSLPIADLHMLGDTLAIMDYDGIAQSINIHSLQASRLVESFGEGTSTNHWNSDLFLLSEGLVLGRLVVQDKDGFFHGELYAISSENHRRIPVQTMNSFSFLSDRGLSVGCYGNLIYVVDAPANQIEVIRLDVTIRSDSYRILHSSKSHGSDDMSSKHWLWSFYHMYDKFPVCGLLSKSLPSDMAIKISFCCPTPLSTKSQDHCRSLMNFIMVRVLKLNKPLFNMDLTSSLSFDTSERDIVEAVSDQQCRPILAFLYDIITIVPVQICRADRNALIVLADGEGKEGNDISDQPQSLQATDIARSMRFGLLSPLLDSWNQHCIVVTSMGKQSTGKSYFLNHLTGSSFAIAGARCTDGAWMTTRVLSNGVLLVILDFEGLGSSDRTEQEDVFLSMLNAALSNFTIFRIDMNFDKDIDGLFSKFQRSVKLMKNDPKLFRGKLCVSVKDVNPDEQEGLLCEFVSKFEGLLGSNKEHNFLTDLYGGKVELNCSPPLGTDGYFESLEMAQDHIEVDLCQDAAKGFLNGRDFLDCLRLVLAKISILDWTSLDKNAEQLLLIKLKEALPGIIRTGCLVSQQYISSNSCIDDDVKEDLKLNDKNDVDADVDVISAQFPAMADKWKALNAQIGLDTVSDRNIDFEVDSTNIDEGNLSAIDDSISRLFDHFMTLSQHDNSRKITTQTQVDFDVFLSYVIHRRKLRITMWANALFNDCLPNEWKLLETELAGRFQTFYSRCDRQCENCLLGCMHSRVYSGTLSHNCGWDHVCRGRCDYCRLDDNILGDTPRCKKQSGHGGPCECGDGDHTCAEP